MKKNYIFTSDRLGFRAWKDSDLDIFADMCASDLVMEFFPFRRTKAEVKAQIQRFNEHLAQHQYTYFAVDTLENQEFIGFIGLAYQTWDHSLTPFTDIGWRLKPEAWGKGLATEGAIASLQYGFEHFGLKEIYSTAVKINTKSIKVMKKIGMKKQEEFEHPNIEEGHPMRTCVLYKITNV